MLSRDLVISVVNACKLLYVRLPVLLQASVIHKNVTLSNVITDGVHLDSNLQERPEAAVRV